MLKVITAPTVEPVDIADVKLQAVIDSDADDDLIGVFITAAREHAEGITGRSLAPQTLEVVLDGFPCGNIQLPRGPVTSITSVKYTDVDGVEQAIVSGTDYDEYMSDVSSYVRPVFGESWPETKVIPGAVRVRYESGWGADDCPKAAKVWIMVRVAGLYAQREGFTIGGNGQVMSEMPRTFADSLLDNITVPEGP